MMLEVRAANLARGMSLADQYDALRVPGKSKLRYLHRQLDAAVLDAYGFSDTEDQLAQLFALNRDFVDAAAARGPGRSSAETSAGSSAFGSITVCSCDDRTSATC